jgi:benzoate-CoA ligase
MLDPERSSSAVGGVPRAYNFANDTLGRYREASHLYKLAYIDPRGNLTYGHLGGRIEQFAIGLEFLSQPEERVLMCLLDTIDWPTVFLGSLYAGRVAVPVNTMLTEDDYCFIMAHCCPAVLVVSEALYPKFEKAIATLPSARLRVLVSGKNVLATTR